MNLIIFKALKTIVKIFNYNKICILNNIYVGSFKIFHIRVTEDELHFFNICGFEYTP